MKEAVVSGMTAFDTQLPNIPNILSRTYRTASQLIDRFRHCHLDYICMSIEVVFEKFSDIPEANILRQEREDKSGLSRSRQDTHSSLLQNRRKIRLWLYV